MQKIPVAVKQQLTVKNPLLPRHQLDTEVL
jgi:hypothetical protein